MTAFQQQSTAQGTDTPDLNGSLVDASFGARAEKKTISRIGNGFEITVDGELRGDDAALETVKFTNLRSFPPSFEKVTMSGDTEGDASLLEAACQRVFGKPFDFIEGQLRTTLKDLLRLPS